MKTNALCLAVACLLCACHQEQPSYPWDNGRLMVDASHTYLQHENGTPFFWLGETGWLLPQRLNRLEAEFYLENCRAAGYNVVQVQTVNQVPNDNAYGQWSIPAGFDFSTLEEDSVYSYWEHMDYLVETAASKGIYIGMVCIWGGQVKAGKMNVEQAKSYGTFLGNRYKDHPNIIWLIGGDIRGDVKTEVWEALATSIKAVDKNHLMTFHPFGRTTSALWFNDAEWLDFNMFQSGHRRYGQKPDNQSIIGDSTEEDNWRYVELSRSYRPLKPVIDGEPSYEGIPQGLHDPSEPLWKDFDARRYAYWSVFAGSFGHTYGNNSIMQMHHAKKTGAYGATEHWVEALKHPGFLQMQYLKRLILAFPYFERQPDQSLVLTQVGTHYRRLVATRGKDYLLVYNYSAVPMHIDLTKIAGQRKKAWWYDPSNGQLTYIGEYENAPQHFSYEPQKEHDDRVLIVTDAAASYVDHLKNS